MAPERQNLRRRTRRFRHGLAFVIIRLLVALAGCVPRRLGLALFAAAGHAVCLFSPGGRKIARENLTLVFGGEWPQPKIRSLVWRVYREIGKNAFDAFFLARRPRADIERIVHHDSIAAMHRASEQGRGLVGITAHLGCYEMLLHTFAAKGYKCFAIGRELFDPRVDAIVRNLRSGENIVYLYRDNNIRGILELLHQGRMMGVLIDQDTQVEGVFAHFLGKPAHTPSGPLRLAMRLKIPVFVLTPARQPDNTHYISISGPIALDDTGDTKRDLAVNVEKVNTIVSDAIRRNPEQWVWMHRRWRKQPGDAGMEGVANIEDYIHEVA